MPKGPGPAAGLNIAASLGSFVVGEAQAGRPPFDARTPLFAHDALIPRVDPQNAHSRFPACRILMAVLRSLVVAGLI